MNPWKLIKDRVVVSRKEDEVFYGVALDEFRSGHVRPGLMAKALAECAGDEQRAKSIYIKLLAMAIRDDHYLAQRGLRRLSPNLPSLLFRALPRTCLMMRYLRPTKGDFHR